jgi:site-specific recombinase XerC
MATLLYGSGLRLLECRLRLQDLDFGTNQIVVRDAKSATDRVTVLHAVAKARLAQHLQQVKRQHEADLRRGADWVAAGGPRPQVPERRPRVALAMDLPGHPVLRRPRLRPAPSPA